MPTKILMSWDIKQESESEYFEFLVHEFIPGLNKLGIIEIQVWYTQYGNCEQKLASGITPTAEKMAQAMHTEQFEALIAKLKSYVTNYDQKVIPATGGFQI